MIDSKSPIDVGKDQRGAVPFGPGPVEQPGTQPNRDDVPLNIRLGQQLRAAREANRYGIEDCGQILRLPVRVLKKLEAGDYTGISESVYLRNYLMSYGTCVGLTREVLHDAVNQLASAEREPVLISTGGIPRSHYLWHRYTTFAAAAILTAVVVVPLVWLGLKGGLDRELTRLEPLNAAPVTRQVPAGSGVSGAHGLTVSRSSGQARLAVAKVRRPAEKPLMASMAPFSALDSIDNDMSSQPVEPVAPPMVAMPGDHTLAITLTSPSWVEVTTASGKRLAYSLLPAGTHKVYHSTQPMNVSIGNTAGAEVRLDGKSIDLGNYQHANVTHFHIALEDGQAVIQPEQSE